MDSHHQQAQNNDHQDGCSGKYLYKQASTRWTPTTEQIRILKELYYTNGVRSPSADQIQRISARLRQYGKIEGKNVFYWFQNHKARERQKKRLTASTTTDHHLLSHHHHQHNVQPMPMSMHRGNTSNSWIKSDQDSFFHSKYHHSSNISAANHTGVSAASSTGVIGSGQMGSFGSFGSATMEMSFRDCSISTRGSGANGATGNNYSWVGFDPSYSSSYSLFSQRSKPVKESFESENDDDDDEDGALETLPLFPMHGDDTNDFFNFKSEINGSDYYAANAAACHDGNGGATTSLELSLCSYTGAFPDAS